MKNEMCVLEPPALYVYHCTCGHRAGFHLNGESHDGETTNCASCSAPVRLEWDGGVTFAHRGVRAKVA